MQTSICDRKQTSGAWDGGGEVAGARGSLQLQLAQNLECGVWLGVHT